jgi:hypothetical protein
VRKKERKELRLKIERKKVGSRKCTEVERWSSVNR